MNALEDSLNTVQQKTFSKLLNMYALRKFSTLLKDERLRWQNSRPQQTFKRWMLRTHESPSELVHQSEAKCKQAPQSKANVCRQRQRQWRCNLENTSLINCTGCPIMCRTPNTNKGLQIGNQMVYSTRIIRE